MAYLGSGKNNIGGVACDGLDHSGEPGRDEYAMRDERVRRTQERNYYM